MPVVRVSRLSLVTIIQAGPADGERDANPITYIICVYLSIFIYIYIYIYLFISGVLKGWEVHNVALWAPPLGEGLAQVHMDLFSALPGFVPSTRGVMTTWLRAMWEIAKQLVCSGCMGLREIHVRCMGMTFLMTHKNHQKPSKTPVASCKKIERSEACGFDGCHNYAADFRLVIAPRPAISKIYRCTPLYRKCLTGK